MVLYSLNIDVIICQKNTEVDVKEILEPNHPDIQKTIDNFNSLYTWDMMFTVGETELRMRFGGNRLFLFYLSGEVVGHTWVSTRHLPHPHIYIYNVFVDKTKHNKELCDSTSYVSVLMDMLSKEGCTNSHLYVDSWHEKAQTFFKRMGFKQSNWLTLQDV
jgi:hypothetical protein